MITLANCWEITYVVVNDDFKIDDRFELTETIDDLDKIVDLFKNNIKQIKKIVPIHIKKTPLDSITSPIKISNFYDDITHENTLNKLKDKIIHHRDIMVVYEKELNKMIDKT